MRFVFGLAVFIALLPLGIRQGDMQSQPATGKPVDTRDFPWAVFAVPTLMHYPLVDLANWQRHQPEIKKLIDELGSGSFAAREAATKRLELIGLPALDALQKAEEKAKGEVRARSAMLVKKIRVAHHLATRVNGVEFKLIVDKEWIAPQKEGQNVVILTLEITNTTKTSYRFEQDAYLVLLSSNGTNVLHGAGQDIQVLTDPVVIGPEKRFLMLFKADLQLYKGELILYFEERSSHMWRARGLSKGTYRAYLTYQSSTIPGLEAGIPFWTGISDTNTETITIK
jgi:hypothetical protein